MNLKVILRTCDKVDSVHGQKRFINLSKKDLIFKCASSLKKSLDQLTNKIKFDLTVIDDHSSEETVKFLKGISNNLISLTDNSGNNKSMMRCYEEVLLSPDCFVYLVEDDYLHLESAIEEMYLSMVYFSKSLGGHQVAVVPNNDPLSYMPSRIEDCRIVLAPNGRHWRTVNTTTFTMMCHKYTILKNWDIFNTFASMYDGARVTEDNTINNLYRGGSVYCFAPIPSLGTHINHVPPHDININ